MSKNLGKELNKQALKQFRARESTSVVTTISNNGYPNTTPVHFIFAIDKKTLLLSLNKNHQCVKNIKNNPRMMISLCEKNDLNISIRCNAKMFKDVMKCNSAMCILRAEIIDIKDDSTHSDTICGIRYKCNSKRGVQFIINVFDELESYLITQC